MLSGVSVSFDGAWSHVRNSYQHTAVLIESANNKIVAASILSKDYRGHVGNYKNDGAPNLMEINALRSIKDSLLDLRIRCFVSDGDIKIRNFIKNLDREPKLILRKDPGHTLLSIMRTLRSINTKNNNIFNPLLNNFESFLKNIVLSIENDEKRVNVYINISNHYAGIHNPSLCMHQEDSACAQFFDESNPIAKQIFDDFLQNTSNVLYDVKPGCATQINESFNHHCKKFINKLFAFRASYSLRTAIAILDWNEQFYTFEVLKRINSTEAPYTIFLQSIKHELETKRKGIEIRATEHWKQMHKQEKWKKKHQTASKSSSAHQINTIINEAVTTNLSKTKKKSDDEDSYFIEEEEYDDIYSNEEWYININESTNEDIDDLSIDDDEPLDEFDLKCINLLNEYQFSVYRKTNIFIKEPSSITCGIIRKGRTCFLIAAVQIFARINSSYIDISQYNDFFDSLKSSEKAIPIDQKLLNKEIEELKNDEDALFTINFLMIELGLLKLLDDNYYIKYKDSVTNEIEIKPYAIKSSIDIKLVLSDPIVSYEIFTASVISQIGHHNSMDNVIEMFLPPVIFIEIWKYNDTSFRYFNFDQFFIKLNGMELRYRCLGTLIHVRDHYKTVVFDNNNMILLDDEMVVNLSYDSEQFNIYKEIEIQDLHYHSILLVFQLEE